MSLKPLISTQITKLFVTKNVFVTKMKITAKTELKFPHVIKMLSKTENLTPLATPA